MFTQFARSGRPFAIGCGVGGGAEISRGRRFGRRGGGFEAGEKAGFAPADGSSVGHRHSFGGRRGGRLFGHGGMRLLLLHLVAQKPRHGYELMKAVEELAGGAYCPSPGVVYPALSLLEEVGHVAVEATEGGRRLYRITPEGNAFLAANRAVVEAMLARAAGGRQRSTDAILPAALAEALGELRAALLERLARGALAPEREQAVAAAIAAAATEARKD